MQVRAQGHPHRRGLDGGIGLPCAQRAQPVAQVSQRMEDSLHSEWWSFRQSDEWL